VAGFTGSLLAEIVVPVTVDGNLRIP